jgi:hypothetical protein
MTQTEYQNLKLEIFKITHKPGVVTDEIMNITKRYLDFILESLPTSAESKTKPSGRK